MKKETVAIIIFMIVEGIGGCLIGFNAGKLGNTVNALLFVLGVVLVSSSATIVSLIFNKNRKVK